MSAISWTTAALGSESYNWRSRCRWLVCDDSHHQLSSAAMSLQNRKPSTGSTHVRVVSNRPSWSASSSSCRLKYSCYRKTNVGITTHALAARKNESVVLNITSAQSCSVHATTEALINWLTCCRIKWLISCPKIRDSLSSLLPFMIPVYTNTKPLGITNTFSCAVVVRVQLIYFETSPFPLPPAHHTFDNVSNVISECFPQRFSNVYFSPFLAEVCSKQFFLERKIFFFMFSPIFSFVFLL